MTREIFLCWKEEFANRNQRTAYEKVMHFRQFCQYMCHMGFDSFIPLTPKRPKESYIPRVYSHEEVAMIFKTIDSTVLQVHHMTTCPDMYSDDTAFPILLALHRSPCWRNDRDKK